MGMGVTHTNKHIPVVVVVHCEGEGTLHDEAFFAPDSSTVVQPDGHCWHVDDPSNCE